MADNIKKKIISFLKNKYKKNLAAVLIFGSYFTGNYNPKESDLDLIILLKSKKPEEKDKQEIEKKIEQLKIFIHHLKTIEEYKKEIYEKGSWSSWVVVQKGAKIIFSTKEFKEFQKYLKENPIKKDKLIEFIKKNVLPVKTSESHRFYLLKKPEAHNVIFQISISNYPLISLHFH